MRPSELGIIDHAGAGIRDETKSPGTFRLRILHDNYIHDFSPCLEVTFKSLIRSSVIKSADKKFSRALGLSNRFLNKPVKKMFKREARLLTFFVRIIKRNERVIGSLITRQHGYALTQSNIFSLFLIWSLTLFLTFISDLSKWFLQAYLIVVILLVLLLV